MPVKVFLSSALRRFIPGYDPLTGTEVTLAREMTVAELCKRIHVPREKVKIVMVNGQNRPFDYILRGDERVGLFPPVGGG